MIKEVEFFLSHYQIGTQLMFLLIGVILIIPMAVGLLKLIKYCYRGIQKGLCFIGVLKRH